MKEVNKKIRYIGIILLILVGFYIILPYIFIGPPASFFLYTMEMKLVT